MQYDYELRKKPKNYRDSNWAWGYSLSLLQNI